MGLKKKKITAGGRREGQRQQSVSGKLPRPERKSSWKNCAWPNSKRTAGKMIIWKETLGTKDEEQSICHGLYRGWLFEAYKRRQGIFSGKRMFLSLSDRHSRSIGGFSKREIDNCSRVCSTSIIENDLLNQAIASFHPCLRFHLRCSAN